MIAPANTSAWRSFMPVCSVLIALRSRLKTECARSLGTHEFPSFVTVGTISDAYVVVVKKG